MTRATWDVIDRGDVPLQAQEMEYDCPGCGRAALIPILGLPIAQMSGGGIVFDPGPRAMPRLIRCRHCRRRYEAV